MTEQSNNKEQKKNQLKKYAVFAAMGIIFVVAMWLIFSPSSKEKDEKAKTVGFNADIPEPSNQEIVSSKQAAYEQEHVQMLQKERMKTLDNFSEMIQSVEPAKKDDDLSLVPENKKSSGHTKSSSSSRTTGSASVDAYRDMNRTLGTFYEKPKETEEVKQLKEELESLKKQVSDQDSKGDAVNDQLHLMEKTYQMASKYFPVNNPADTKASQETPAKKTGKSEASPVTGVKERVVSSLAQPLTDMELLEAFSKERNFSFHSVDGATDIQGKNTISACIHDDQTVSDGMEAQRNVRIRLTEPMLVGGTIIPAHTILTGQARIGERMDVEISSIEYQGRIYATEIAIYDVDGQRGIAIPPSLEVNAAKEVAANTGSNMGTSFTFSQSAGQQIAADLGRGVIQGTSQYIAKKMRVIKVHLKAGYQVFLLPKDNL